jgi:hypothetical protein
MTVAGIKQPKDRGDYLYAWQWAEWLVLITANTNSLRDNQNNIYHLATDEDGLCVRVTRSGEL